MKTVFLVRHAKSSWKYPDLDDFERPLNRRGRNNLKYISRFLNDLNVVPDLILSSPATRAAVTARGIAAGTDYPSDRIRYSESIYLADEDALLEVIKGLDDSVKNVILVGHNPGLTRLASYIGDREIDNIPTCGVFCVELDIISWSNIKGHSGRMRFIEFPGKEPL